MNFESNRLHGQGLRIGLAIALGFHVFRDDNEITGNLLYSARPDKRAPGWVVEIDPDNDYLMERASLSVYPLDADGVRHWRARGVYTTLGRGPRPSTAIQRAFVTSMNGEYTFIDPDWLNDGDTVCIDAQGCVMTWDAVGQCLIQTCQLET